MGNSFQLAFEEQQKWELLNHEFGDVVGNNEFPVGGPPAGRPIHRIELVPGAAPSFVSRQRGPLQLQEDTEGQVDELQKKDNV